MKHYFQIIVMACIAGTSMNSILEAHEPSMEFEPLNKSEIGDISYPNDDKVMKDMISSLSQKYERILRTTTKGTKTARKAIMALPIPGTSLIDAIDLVNKANFRKGGPNNKSGDNDEDSGDKNKNGNGNNGNDGNSGNNSADDNGNNNNNANNGNNGNNGHNNNNSNNNNGGSENPNEDSNGDGDNGDPDGADGNGRNRKGKRRGYKQIDGETGDANPLDDNNIEDDKSQGQQDNEEKNQGGASGLENKGTGSQKGDDSGNLTGDQTNSGLGASMLRKGPMISNDGDNAGPNGSSANQGGANGMNPPPGFGNGLIKGGSSAYKIVIDQHTAVTQPQVMDHDDHLQSQSFNTDSSIYDSHSSGTNGSLLTSQPISNNNLETSQSLLTSTSTGSSIGINKSTKGLETDKSKANEAASTLNKDKTNDSSDAAKQAGTGTDADKTGAKVPEKKGAPILFKTIIVLLIAFVLG